MFNYMAGIVEESGYAFLNMNDYYDEIGIVFEEDFADYGSHTNAVGAEKCTNFLKEYLTAHYTLPDRRGDVSYASWDKSYELWKTRQDEAVRTIRERIANGDYAEIAGEE